MRRPHYFWIDRVNTYPPQPEQEEARTRDAEIVTRMHGADAATIAEKRKETAERMRLGWKTYLVVEHRYDQYGLQRRIHVWGDPPETEAYAMRCEGHFVGTKEEVLAITGPASSENSCGHEKGDCDCASGLIVNKMYEISRKNKPPLVARYMRWKKQTQKHEFKSDTDEWTSVHTKDIKERVKGEFQTAPCVDQTVNAGSNSNPEPMKPWTHEQVMDWLKEKHPEVYALYKAEGLPRWIPLPKELRPQGWHAMRPKPSVEIGEKVKAGCEYCASHQSSRSCPIHGWHETRSDQYAHHNVRADGHRTDQRYCAQCRTKPCAIC